MSIVTTDSPLRDTDSPPRISVATVFVIGGALIGYTALSLGVLVAVFLLSSDPLSSARTIVAVFMSLHAAGCLTLVIWLSRRRGIPIRALGVRRPGWKLLHALWEFPLILIVATMAQILFSVLILGQSEPPDNGASRDIAGVGPLVFMVGLLGTAALTPLWEELFFRGVLQGAASQRWGSLIGIIVTAITFAVSHSYLILPPYYLVLGLGLSLLRVFHRDLWGSLAVHMGLNGLVSMVALMA